MSAAGVLNGLVCEEEAGVDRRVVVSAILGVAGGGGVGADVFEEEYYAVDWTAEA